MENHGRSIGEKCWTKFCERSNHDFPFDQKCLLIKTGTIEVSYKQNPSSQRKGLEHQIWAAKDDDVNLGGQNLVVDVTLCVQFINASVKSVKLQKIVVVLTDSVPVAIRTAEKPRHKALN